MTTMNFTLSPTLLGELIQGGSGNGVNAYAVSYLGGTYSSLITLVNNGQSTGTTSLDLPSGDSGQDFFIIQHGAPNSSLPSQLTVSNNGFVNTEGPKNNFEYQLIEFTLSTKVKDQVNDTADIS